MANIYPNNPTVSHTLSQFNDYSAHLFAVHEDNDSFIRFVLTGEFLDDDEQQPKQAFIDPVQNVVEPGHPLNISRDYDSLLGIADTILVDAPISVFSVPHPSFALKTSIHIKHPIAHGEVIIALNTLLEFFNKIFFRHELL